jgi:hypothetical protein
LLGVQPGTYTDANGNTVRPLGDIGNEVFALVNSLDATQHQAPRVVTNASATQRMFMAQL